MKSFENLLHEINLNCFNKIGFGFEIEFAKISWSKKYRAKKFLFFYDWECEDSLHDECSKVRGMLSRLPKGIKYVENTTITKPLPSKVEPYGTATENGITTYTVIVSEEYSKKVLQMITDNQVFVSGTFSSHVLEEADKFKNKILAKHYEILEPLYTKGLLSYSSIDNLGFTDYDHGFPFQSVGMKHLSDLSERLGLALALAEYGKRYLSKGQFYYIMVGLYEENVDIYLKSLKLESENLKEW